MKMRLIRLVLEALILSVSFRSTFTLPSVPENVKVDSEIIFSSPDYFEMYVVEEIIDKVDKTVRITVSDLTVNLQDNELTSYYRIKDNSNSSSSVDDHIVTFNHKDLLCSNGRLSNWHLKELTSMLAIFYESSDFNTEAVESDKTLIGPLALLQIVYSNAHLFHLESEKYLEGRLVDTYFYQAVTDIGNNMIMKTVCFMSKPNVENQEKPEVGKSLLSELETSSHPMVIGIVIMNKDDEQHNKMSSIELFDMRDTSITRLYLTLFLVQKRSTSCHSGFGLGSIDEQNPFTLPSGSGCSSVIRQDIFYIDATQFSGAYESKDFPSKRYIAYDSSTSHLRIDLLGEYKIILNLETRKMTYITDKNVKTSLATSISESNCAQTYLGNKDEDRTLNEAKNMEDVLGLGEKLGLIYLGTKLLEDGTHCLVYEREISSKQIPLIIKLSTRYRISDNSRFFLVYYFVDELSKDSTSTYSTYKTKWLKRIELSSLNSFSIYKILNSQITFSQFAWNLELTSDLSVTSNKETISSVRTFDTIECSPIDRQIQFELLMQQQELHMNLNAKAKANLMDYSLEEGVISYLTEHTKISRSSFNKFELIWLGKGTNGLNNLLIRSRLTLPAEHVTSSKLLGWLKDDEGVASGKQGTILMSRAGMVHFECLLKLVAEYPKKEINMIFCKDSSWCGYLDNLGSLDYERADGLDSGSTLSSKLHKCEIYSLNKVVDSHAMKKEKYSLESIENSVEDKNLLIGFHNEENDERVFIANVAKLSMSRGTHLESMGTILRESLCYTNETQLVNEERTRFKLDTIELKFDRYHSLVYCHKACQLRWNCLTYSYAKSSRVCTLTNIPTSYLPPPINIQANLKKSTSLNAIGLKEDTDCTLYEFNSMYRFQITDIELSTSLSSLYENEKYYYAILSNLNNCANLCHENTYVCNFFYYDLMNSICLIEDKDNKIYKNLHKSNDNEELTKDDLVKHFIYLFGDETWQSNLHFRQYTLDYEQFFANEERNLESSNNNKNVYSPTTTTLKLMTTLFDLSHDDCLKECLLIQENCLIASSCLEMVHSIPSRYCTMYTFLTGNSTDSLDSTYYAELIRHSKRLDSSNREGCVNYHLNEDSFLLKGKLSRQLNDELLLEDKKNNQKSEMYVKEVNSILELSKSKSEWPIAVSTLLIGILLGFVVAQLGLLTKAYDNTFARRKRKVQLDSSVELGRVNCVSNNI